MTDGFFDLISLVYVLAACFAGVTFWRERRQIFDEVFTARDRDLAQTAGFLFLTPIGVFVHELAHFATASAFGARELAIHFRVYWGFVTYVAALDPVGHFLIAVAGPAASAILGLAALIAARRLRAASRVALQSFGQATLALILVAYPLLSIAMGEGDFLTIYSFATPIPSLLAAVVHVAAIVAMVRLRPQVEWAAPLPPPPDGDAPPSTTGAKGE